MCMQVNDNNRSQDTCAIDVSPAQGFSFYCSEYIVVKTYIKNDNVS